LKVKEFLNNIPQNCKHKKSLKKDNCLILCSKADFIIEHDNCVSSSGCDAIAVDFRNNKLYLVEVKKGGFDSKDAKRAIKQLDECIDYYGEKLKGFEFKPIILRGNKKRMEGSAREFLIRRKHELRKRGLRPQILNCSVDISLKA